MIEVIFWNVCVLLSFVSQSIKGVDTWHHPVPQLLTYALCFFTSTFRVWPKLALAARILSLGKDVINGRSHCFQGSKVCQEVKHTRLPVYSIGHGVW
jgi:hypothetical protein